MTLGCGQGVVAHPLGELGCVRPRELDKLRAVQGRQIHKVVGTRTRKGNGNAIAAHAHHALHQISFCVGGALPVHNVDTHTAGKSGGVLVAIVGQLVGHDVSAGRDVEDGSRVTRVADDLQPAQGRVGRDGRGTRLVKGPALLNKGGVASGGVEGRHDVGLTCITGGVVTRSQHQATHVGGLVPVTEVEETAQDGIRTRPRRGVHSDHPRHPERANGLR